MKDPVSQALVGQDGKNANHQRRISQTKKISQFRNSRELIAQPRDRQ